MNEIVKPTRALAGLKVLEISTFVAGPFCGSLLAEQGAEVIKIELPGIGDPLRGIGEMTDAGASLHFLSEQRNKKSITLDLRLRLHADAFLDLISDTDVLIENFRVGTLEKWGLGWDVLHARNPRLVMARITGYGQTGPYSSRSCIGRIANGFGGLSFVTGAPELPPANPGNPMLGDYTSGINAALGIMFALRARETTGRGQVVDIAMYETIFRLLDEIAPVFAATGKVRHRIGSAAEHAIPHNHYETKDRKWIGIACTSDKLWARLAVALGEAALVNGGRFSKYSARKTARAEVDGIVSAWCKRSSRDEVIRLCEECEVPCGPVYGIDEIFDDPQYKARNTLLSFEDPRIGNVVVPNVVIKLSDTPGGIDSLGPDLGAHNQEILVERLGLSHDEAAAIASPQKHSQRLGAV